MIGTGSGSTTNVEWYFGLDPGILKSISGKSGKILIKSIIWLLVLF